MNEKDLLELWAKARSHVIVSQFAPTFLLTVFGAAIALHHGFGHSVAARIAVAGILLASGILGFVAQYSAADEAATIAADLKAIENPSLLGRRIAARTWWMPVVKFVTPAIFVVIYLAILWDLFIAR